MEVVNQSKKTFSIQEKVRFQHCDFAGIVFYPRYCEMINATVEDWFDLLKLPFLKMHELGYGIPTNSLQIQFHAPARLNDMLTKHLTVTKIGNSSVTLKLTFTNADNTVILEAENILVFVVIDKTKNTILPTPWFKELRENMATYAV